MGELVVRLEPWKIIERKNTWLAKNLKHVCEDVILVFFPRWLP